MYCTDRRDIYVLILQLDTCSIEHRKDFNYLPSLPTMEVTWKGLQTCILFYIVQNYIPIGD